MKFYWFTLGTLAVWRVVHLLAAEDGPWDIIYKLRAWVGDRAVGKLLDCFYCLSVWIAAPAAFLLGETLTERAWLWPALSAGAILFNRLILKNGESAKATYTEDP